MSNTDDIRRAMIDNDMPALDLAATIGADGPTWTTEAMQAEFEPLGFQAPFIVVKRRSDGQVGTLEFVHGPPRIYFGWVAHE